MSFEDDTEGSELELRELVTQTLDENGILSQIKAQLRAELYLALENDLNSGYHSTYNKLLQSKLKNPDIRIIFCLVREFLDYFELNYTCSVFEKESLMGSSFNYDNREKLIQELDIGIDTLHNSPLLLEILNIARSSFNLSVRDIQNDIKFNSTANSDNKNTTYDVINEQHNHSDYHDASIKETAVDTSESEISNNIKIINGEDHSSGDKKVNSVHEEVATQQSEVRLNNNHNDHEKNGIDGNKKEVEDKFETDDTYEGTSSIAEDSVVSNKEPSPLIDFEKSLRMKSISDSNDESPKSTSAEKRKFDKTEKLKPMSALSALSDLPPLQLNKSRNSDTVLLPSLYSKDFRDKSTVKDIDKFLDNFDPLDNYEEDFLSSGSPDDNDEGGGINIFVSAQQNANKLAKSDTANAKERTDECSNNTLNENDNNEQSKGNKNEEAINNSTGSISEEFDLNSNVEDILNSGSAASAT